MRAIVTVLMVGLGISGLVAMRAGAYPEWAAYVGALIEPVVAAWVGFWQWLIVDVAFARLVP